jgi:hypothetical protein
MIDGGDSEWRRPFFLINNKTSKLHETDRNSKTNSAASGKQTPEVACLLMAATPGL